jgi:hypothetical protein
MSHISLGNFGHYTAAYKMPCGGGGLSLPGGGGV